MEKLTEKFERLLTDDTRAQFDKYYELLKLYNEQFNLTAITDRAEVYVKHFADSIAALDLLSGSVLDVGAGAGFPSLPLKILKPSLNIVMADSLNKRVGFLNDVIKTLNLTDIEAVHVRAEDLPKSKLYDSAVARAVAPLPTLCEYLLPFVKVGGTAIAYKAKDAMQELETALPAIKILGGAKPYTVDFTLDDEIPRTLIVIRKVNATPARYPRSGNKPRLLPLI